MLQCCLAGVELLGREYVHMLGGVNFEIKVATPSVVRETAMHDITYTNVQSVRRQTPEKPLKMLSARHIQGS